MGGGSYSINNATGLYDSAVRTSNLKNRIDAGISANYFTASAHEVFKGRSINNAMSPYDVELRESRDSEEHPNSVAIIIALDVTGSMYTIPHYLIKDGLPNIMGNIIQKGIKDPQVMFVAIGDHTCDEAPLQISQFESSDELLDHWLEKVYLEGNGGGNDGESYFLAWYFAAMKTSIDCFEKRKKKGFLFTIGDEPNLQSIPASSLQKIMGKGQYDAQTLSAELLSKAQEKYHVFHLHMKQGSNGNRQDVMDGWKQLMGDNLIIVEKKEDVEKAISDKISSLILSNTETEEVKEEIKTTQEFHHL